MYDTQKLTFIFILAIGNIMKKLRVGILGTGNIGTDLLIKIIRSPYLECVCFAGRNLNSKGMLKAKERGINTSDQGINAFTKQELKCELVFDATSAQDHYRHARVFSMLGIRAIDMTPAHVGEFCIPPINGDTAIFEQNINMITCGGQASIPAIYALSQAIPDISRVEIRSRASEDSIGPATIANIDKYYSSTASAVTQFCGIDNVSVDLYVDPSEPKPDMLTKIKLHTPTQLNPKIIKSLSTIVNKVKQYVPGYELVGQLEHVEGGIELSIKVTGLGDWVPKHAGNLDIINCAAIAIAEKYAQHARKNALEEELQELEMKLYS